MNRKELRIGNFVHVMDRSNEIHLPNTLQVFSIMEIGADCTICDITKNWLTQKGFPVKSCFDLSPIPLTEEWLLKFGFKRTIRNNDSGYCQYGFQRFGFDFSVDIELDTEPNFYLDRKMIPNLRYVHQFQNFYFALTGEGIEVKEPVL